LTEAGGKYDVIIWDKLTYVNVALNKFAMIIRTRPGRDEFIKGIVRGRISIGNVTHQYKGVLLARSYATNYRRRLCC